jgi:hypothetical protein
MADAKNFNGGFVSVFEEEPVVSTTETKAILRGLELFHIARARGEITVGAWRMSSAV